MSLGVYHTSLIRIIYVAHDNLAIIPREHWHEDDYFNLHKTKESMGLFGHYVLLLPEFKATDPRSISFNQYMIKAAPLSSAINTFLSLLLDDTDDQWDAYSIVAGKSPLFPQKHPYDRAMALFEFIEKGYPRHIHTRTHDTIPIEINDTAAAPLGRLDLPIHAAQAQKI